MRLVPRDKRPVTRDPSEPAPDPRIWGRHYTRPGAVGLRPDRRRDHRRSGVYLAFAKKLPFTSEGYQLNATFENAATLRETSPVRIAGVNVGEVTERRGARATRSRSPSASTRRASRSTTTPTVEIRPRLFLEGNFFLDLDPGSPSAPELDDGGDDPGHPDRDRGPARRGADRAAGADPRGPAAAARGLRHRAHLRADRRPTTSTRTPTCRARPAAESLNDALRYGGAGRARHRDRQRGAARRERARPLRPDPRAAASLFGKLDGREAELQDLITNFNVFAGALADESDEPLARRSPSSRRRSRRRSPSLRRPQRRAAAAPGAGDRARRRASQELPATIDAANPWLDQTGPLLRDDELGGLARAAAATPRPASREATAASTRAVRRS